MRTQKSFPIVNVAVLASLLGLGLVSPTHAQFTSDNVSLYSWLNLSQLGNASNGNDCWGYVSPSGREYALMGVSNRMYVVEITDPANPAIRGSVLHANSLWGDIKTYQDYAYVVNESAGGMDVVDLSDVDSGTVTLVQRMTTGGLSSSHNVAIDEDSGFLYLCGSNLNGGRLIAYDLSNPASPAFAGQVSSIEGTYVHDAQIVTYTSGTYAGKQIAFSANGGTGLDIYDVTNKSNMFRLSRRTYPTLGYAHQCWLSEDRQYIYLNDETNGINETLVFDVSDLSNPVLANIYDAGVLAIDHNQYVHDGFIYEAEYHAGLRIFCADDPVSPIQVGWFDTYPENDTGGFDGAWSTYPYFPSGTVIVSDITRGLFVLDVSDALSAGSVSFAYPEGRTEMIDPLGGSTIRVELTGTCGAEIQPASGLLHYDAGMGFVSVPMDEISSGVYDAIFPAFACPSEIPYYFSAETTSGFTKLDPSGAPSTIYQATVAAGQAIVLEDNFEADLGWTTEVLGATFGQWQRGVPVDDPGWDFDPQADGDGSGQCYLTQNELGNTDVDNGAVRLTSPVLDMTDDNLVLSYDYYLYLNNAETGVDELLVEISSAGDAGPWSTIATHKTDGGLTWRHEEIPQADLEMVTELTSNMKVRFTALDADPPSVVEAGVDGLTITSLECPKVACGADQDGNGEVRVPDLIMLLGAWGPNPGHPADLDGNGEVRIPDLIILLAAWGPCV